MGRPPLVFVHGWCCDRTYWRHQVKHFSMEHMVVAIDLAGHGDSGQDRREWSMAAFGQDVVAVVEKLHLTQAVLIGHSMGGTVILEAARQTPERVGALVPVDTFFDVEQRLTRWQAEQFLTPFRIDFQAALRPYLKQNMFGPQTDPALMEAIITDMSLTAPAVALGSLESLVTYDHRAALREVRAPIFCINSDKYATKVDVARRYAPSFDVRLVAGVGHFLMIEKPEEFNRLLARTVTEVVPAPDRRTGP